MKKLLIVSLAVLSMNAFSQSYMVLSNGTVITTDKNGKAYDIGNFMLPSKVSVNGGHFFVADEKLITISEEGFLYNKDQKIKKIKGKGANYVITDDSEVITVVPNGFFFAFKKDDAIKKVARFGGNYFIVNTDEKKKVTDLFTVSSVTGRYSSLKVQNLNPADITVLGGNYFQTKDGRTFTVSNEGLVSSPDVMLQSADGNSYTKSDIKVAAIKKFGGSALIDANGRLFTVSQLGTIIMPSLPLSLKVASINKMGENYIIDSDGKYSGIDFLGNVKKFDEVDSKADLKTNAQIISY